MMMNLIQLPQSRTTASSNMAGMLPYLAPLIGEPFRFARVSYGDELTLHFGALRPARSPKLGNTQYGAYILGVRGSSWMLKSGQEPQVLTAGIDLANLPGNIGTPIEKEAMEANPLLSPDSRVLAVFPFVVTPVNGFGLQLRFSDGGTFLTIPIVSSDDSDEESLPEIADWELASPSGLLSAGPGLNWSFQPSGGSQGGA